MTERPAATMRPSTDPKYPGYVFVGQKLLELGRKFFIIETGCKPPTGRIYRTEFFQQLADNNQGSIISVELDGKAVSYARSLVRRGAVAQQEPIQYLGSASVVPAADLLFLGTERPTPYEAELQRAGELAACYHRLKPGCLIAVDGDCQVIRQFFRQAALYPIFEGQITVWRKP